MRVVVLANVTYINTGKDPLRRVGGRYPFKCLHHPIIHTHTHTHTSWTLLLSLLGEHLSRDAYNIRQNPSQSLTNTNLSKNKKIKKNHLP